MRIGIIATLLAGVFILAPAAQAEDSEVPKLVKMLQSGDAAARRTAADELGSLRAEAKAAVPELVKALGSRDTELQWRAARALAAMGPAAAAAAPALTRQLTAKQAKVRAYSAYALGSLGEAGMSAVPALIKNVTDSDDLVRRAVIGALRRLDPDPEISIPLMIKVLEDADPKVLMAALHSLAEDGVKAVPRLIMVLDNEKARYWACLVIAEIGPDAKDAVPALVKIVKVDEPEVRMHALLALAEIGPGAAGAEAAAIERLDNDEHNGVRYAAAYALGKMGAKKADKSLRAAVKSDDKFLHMISAWSLAKLHPEDKQAVETAVRAILLGLKDKDSRIRAGAAKALVDFDAPPELTAPAVVAVLKESGPRVLAPAMDVLAAQGAKSVPRMVRALGNKDLRIYAAEVLGRIGPEAKDAVPALVAAIPSDDPAFCREVQLALGAIGPAAAPAVAALTKSLSAEDGDLCYTACYALGKIGPAASAAAGNLSQGLKAEDPFRRIACAWALLHVAPDSDRATSAAVSTLVDSLKSENELVRLEAVTALGESGKAGKSAVPALAGLTSDPNKQVRSAAAEALRKLSQ